MKKSKFSLEDKIQNMVPDLPPKQRKLAGYILKNLKPCAFMTSTTLGTAAGVSESTVIRFASYMGYKGYPAFQQELRESLKNELSALDKFSIEKVEDASTVYQDIFESEVGIINRTLKELSSETFNNAVEALYNKESILTVGFKGSYCLSSYAGYNLSKIHAKVQIIDQWNERWFNYLNDLSDNTAAILFGFPRYPKNVVTIAETLKKRNVSLIVITDSVVSPIAEYADFLFIIPVKKAFFVDHLSAVMCLINALIFSLSYKDKDKTEKYLKRFEKFANENNFFVKSD
ncbi:MAG: MurR/RpiR family transcriptional regulator [Psychrilyobacter sp.]|uniref:MurR/RpiR family transcriptional regulator n=1 Tax=Psychrilyobacter sp. TaxID=2586924 RepID=UPI003C72AC44